MLFPASKTITRVAMAEVNGSAPQQHASTTSASHLTVQPNTTANAGPAASGTTGAITSLEDSGTSTRPRDARTLHMVLAAMGVTAYQERVPLQLLDFAYRYTNSILSDALHLASEGYVGPNASTGTNEKGKHAAADASQVTLAAVRLATSSRLGYQFSNVLPKETLLELAAERNRIRLPAVDKEYHFGVRLPHERFCLTGTGWTVPEEWNSEEKVEEDGGGGSEKGKSAEKVNGEKGVSDEKEDEDMAEGDENGEDGFEQVFGEKEEEDDAMKDD